MIPGNANPLLLASAAAADTAANITKSLRFNRGDSAHLIRTPSSAGNRRTFTISFWVKRTGFGTDQSIFSTGTSASLNGNTNIKFETDNAFRVVPFDLSGSGTELKTTAILRDPSSFYHCVIAYDTTQATSSDRAKIYINGVEADLSVANYPSQNAELGVNSNIAQVIGRYNYATTNYLDAYVADFYLIDGSQLDATSFGAFDDNGVWQSASYSGTFGTNGFHLFDFASESGIGADSSGNDNDFTVNNLTNKDVQTFDGVAFDGNGDYLSLASSSDFGFGTGDFTIEAFVLSNTNSNTPYILDGRSTLTAVENVPTLYINGNNFEYWVNGSARITAGNSTAGTWRHVAVVRDGSTTTLYVDGTSVGTFSDSINYATCPLIIGQRKSGASQSLDGFISNLRIVKGTAVYTANFTVPTAPLSNVTNTTLLCCQSSSSATAKTVGGTITANGNVFAGTFSDTSADIDVLRDVPTNGDSSDDTGAGGEISGCYATLNPLIGTPSSLLTFSNGNLECSASASTGNSGKMSTQSTIGVRSGKWFWECSSMVNSLPGVAIDFGIANSYVPGETIILNYSGTYYNQGSATAPSQAASWTSSDVIGVALNMDDKELTFYKNGTAQGTFTGLIDAEYFPSRYQDSSSSDSSSIFNFGQRAFAYAAPSGYKCLNTASLPTPTIADGSDNFDTLLYTGTGANQSISGLSFGSAPDFVWIKRRNGAGQHVLTDSVRGTSKQLFSALTNAEQTSTTGITSFDSDGFSLGTNVSPTGSTNGSSSTYAAWCWNASANSNKTYTVKVVSDSGNKYRFDDFGTSAVTLDLEEGSTYVFDQSDSSNSGHPLRFSTTSDGTHNSGTEYTTGVTTTGTPGSAGAKTTIVVASSAPTLYYYCSAHSGMGGQANTNSTAGASNFDGSIQSTVKANLDAGMSIVSYTGTGANATVGHQLNAVPELILLKDRDAAKHWAVWHKDLSSNAHYLLLNQTDAEANTYPYWNGDHTTSTFTLGTTGGSNESGDDFIAYCFAPVAGYSAFGSYEGTGSASTGAFVYTGMRPRWIMTKAIEAAGVAADWLIFDTERDPHNVADKNLSANYNGQEQYYSANLLRPTDIDILSNGFKIRNNRDASNRSGTTYIYAAFSENAFSLNGGLAR